MSDSESVEYLQTGFDPKSLTVPRLRSILVAHNVQYPSTAKKPQLIDLFNEHVVPQSKKILAARARVKRMSRGIVDADSQESVHDDQELMPPPTVSRTRSPRKSTRLKSESVDPEPEPVLRESPLKRQSRSASAQAVGVSDTETSTDMDAGTRPTRKPRRVIAATTPPIKLEPPREESFFKRTPETEGVFSSDNPFQSGGSSPPAPSRTPSGRRKTTGPEATKPKTPSNRRRTDGPFDSDLYRSADEAISQRLSNGPRTPQPEVVEAGEEFTPEAQLELQQEEAANPQRALLARAKLGPPAVRKKKVGNKTGIFSFSLVLTILAIYAGWYRQEKIAVGYCGIGRPAEYPFSFLENIDVPDWAVPIVEPQCDPCPPHGICYEDYSVRCEQDFVLKPHPLALGGLVPLPPTCEPDGEKVRRVQAVADRAVEELRDRRAKYECGESLTEEGAPVDSPLIDEEELRETLSQKRSKRMSKDEFDDLWTAAIGEIKSRDEVEVVDPEPEQARDPGRLPTARLSSNSLARLPLTCAVRRHFWLALARHRVGLGSLVLAVLSALYARQSYRSHRKTAAQIPGLVDIVLERLAAQKELAFEDGSDDAFLFLPNLRDDVLRSRHSLAEREKVWAKVRQVVEQNSNVRTGQREGRNGEVGRAWEWIGPTSGALITDGGSGGRRRKSGRVSWGPDVKENDGETPTAEGKEVVKGFHKSWEEGRPIY
ncbi:Man1-Src1p-C-terminal domain-containing protein [Coniochaeta sp. 2T2.1]|nr:Man1-Src1p-C-terminal domain-containing protein [Coniochaeta sp. 2T2.1]